MVVISDHRDQTQFEAFAEILLSKNVEVPVGPGVYRFEGDEPVRAFRDLEVQQELTHVQDLGDDRIVDICTQGNANRIVLSSPNNDQLRRINQDSRYKILFMPVWTIDEVREAVRLAQNDPVIQENATVELDRAFEKYGGVPRYLFEFNEEQRAEALSNQ